MIACHAGSHDRFVRIGLALTVACVELAYVMLVEVRGHVARTAFEEPLPKFREVLASRVLLAQPHLVHGGAVDHVVAAVVFGDVDAVGEMVGRDDHAAVHAHRKLLAILGVDLAGVGRTGDEHLGAFVERPLGHLVQVGGFRDAHERCGGVLVEGLLEGSRVNVADVPRADRRTAKLDRRVFAHALPTGNQQREPRLLPRLLHAVSHVIQELLCVACLVEDAVDVFKERLRHLGNAQFDRRAAVRIEQRRTRARHDLTVAAIVAFHVVVFDRRVGRH